MTGFVCNDRGAIALIFAILMIPIIMLSAGGIDYARAVHARQQLHRALEAAAGGLIVRDDMRGNAEAVLFSHLQARLRGVSPDDIGDVIVADKRGRIELRARLRVRTPFLGLIGMSEVWVGASARTRALDDD